MPDDGRLAITITHGSGAVTRLGPDEVDAANIPLGLTFSTSMPGGFKDCSLQLLVRIDLETPIELFDDVTIYGAGGEVAWEGRITQLPRSHGDTYGMTPGAVGWAANLSDDPSFRMVYVDRDPGSWTDTPLDRKIALAAAGNPQGKIPVTIGPGGITWLPPNEALPFGEVTEIQYDCGPGLASNTVLYNGTRNGASWAGSFEAATLYTDTTAAMPSTQASAALTLDGTNRVATVSNAERYLLFRARASAAVTPAAGHQQSYSSVAVIGNHGLTSSTLGSGVTGFLASDVIAHILTNAAPELTFTTGVDGSITPSTFAIPHLVFADPITAEDAILFVNAYHQYEFGVYENREFFWRPTDPDRCLWEVRLSEGAKLELEGQSAGKTYNGVLVDYVDPTGQRKTVGPPGADADATDSALADTSADNPVNSHGITRKWARMTISQVTTPAGAVQLGAIWLAEQAIPARKGRITVRGTIRHATRGLRPTWAPRAGDYARIADHPTDVPRRIIETTYQHDSREIQMEVGTESTKLTSVLERLNVYSIGRYA